MAEYAVSALAVSYGCRHEAAKIIAHLRDLDGTVGSLAEERGSVSARATDLKLAIEQADSLIADELQPVLMLRKEEIDRLLSQRSDLVRFELDTQRIQELWALRHSFGEVDEPAMAESAPGYDVAALRALCDVLEEVLAAWRYPNLRTVEFDTTDADFVISGQKRQSHGKGFRAIGYSAFAVSLMQYCDAYERAHPGLVVLDSPLTTFKERDTRQTGDEVPGETQNAFWENLASSPEYEQVIILENKEPSDAIEGRYNHIEFTGQTGIGRQGFFPG